MAYNPQYLFSETIAKAEKAPTIPYAALMQDREWKQRNQDLLAANQADLNAKFQDITATNTVNENILKERADYYESQQDEILNSKDTIQEKYRKMGVLASEAAKDPRLQEVRDFTKDYQENLDFLTKNKLLLEDDIYRAAMADIERNNELGIGNPEGLRAGNQFSYVNAPSTPDIAKRTSEFLNGMKPNETYSLPNGATLTKGDNGYLYRIEGREEFISEDRAKKIAQGYVAQAPDLQEFFAYKDRGAEIAFRENLRNQNPDLSEEEIDKKVQEQRDKYGGTVYDKQAYIEAGISPTLDHVSYSKKGVQIKDAQDWQQRDAIQAARKKSEEEKKGSKIIPQKVNTSVSEGVANTTETIDSYQAFTTKIGNLTAQKLELMEQLQNPSVLTGKQIKQKENALEDIEQELENVKSIEHSFELAQVGAFTGNPGKYNEVIQQRKRMINNGTFNPKTNTYDYTKGDRTKRVRGDLEIGELADNYYNGDEKNRENVINSIRGLENMTGTKLSIKEGINAFEFAHNIGNSNVAQDYYEKWELEIEGTKAYKLGQFMEETGVTQEELKKANSGDTSTGQAIKNKLIKSGNYSPAEAQAMVSLLISDAAKVNLNLDTNGQDITDVFETMGEHITNTYMEGMNSYFEDTKGQIQYSSYKTMQVPSLSKRTSTEPGYRESENARASLADATKAITTHANQGNLIIHDNNNLRIEPEDLPQMDVISVDQVGMRLVNKGGVDMLPLTVTAEVLEDVEGSSSPKKVERQFVVYGDVSKMRDVYGNLKNYYDVASNGQYLFEGEGREYVSELLDHTKDKNLAVQFKKSADNLSTTTEKSVYPGKVHVGLGVKTKIGENPETIVEDFTYFKTGQDNYIFSGSPDHNPIESTYQYMMSDNVSPNINKQIESIPSSTDMLEVFRKVPKEKRTPEMHRIMQYYMALANLKDSHNELEANNFRIEANSQDSAVKYLENQQQKLKIIRNMLDVSNDPISLQNQMFNSDFGTIFGNYM